MLFRCRVGVALVVLTAAISAYPAAQWKNVHPSNALQLIKALQQAGKSFEVQVGPDQGPSNVNQQRMMEFFIENLVMRPAAQDGTR